MNIPNILTLFRLFLIPVFILVFFSDINNSFVYSVIIFLAAGFTDILDGYIARKKSLITKWGIIIDPLTDKLMLLTVLSCFVMKNIISSWILIIILIKESLMIIAGAILYNKDTIIPSNIFGKVTTFLFYISVFILSFNLTIGTYLLYVSVIVAIITLVNYLLLYLKNKTLI